MSVNKWELLCKSLPSELSSSGDPIYFTSLRVDLLHLSRSLAARSCRRPIRRFCRWLNPCRGFLLSRAKTTCIVHGYLRGTQPELQNRSGLRDLRELSQEPIFPPLYLRKQIRSYQRLRTTARTMGCISMQFDIEGGEVVIAPLGCWHNHTRAVADRRPPRARCTVWWTSTWSRGPFEEPLRRRAQGQTALGPLPPHVYTRGAGLDHRPH